MTMREFELKHEGVMEFEAWKAIIHRRAMNEDKVDIDKLIGREKEINPSEVLSISEHKKIQDEIEKRIRG